MQRKSPPSKPIEDELRLSEQRWRLALQGAYGGAWDWDLLHDTAWWSEEMYDLWGVTPGTVMNFENSLAAVYQPDRQKLQESVEHAIAGGGSYEHEFRIQHPRHGLRWMLSLGLLEYDDRGQAIRMNGVTFDITERKQAEGELRQSHEQLEHRIIERTAALIQAKQEAENANAVKSRFLATASHDLRQPLQAVEIYLAVLARQLESNEQREICDKAQQSLRTMGELLDALLDMSKLESGTIIPEKRHFRLQVLLDRLVEHNIQQAQAKGLQLEASDCDCMVYSDPALLERVIGNFISNAIRYTKHGRVSIECQLSQESLRIAVSDTGIGIPREALNKIFEAYYQLDNPSRERSRGLGLGLHIARYIATLLGHELKVASTPGHGSTFTLIVPLGREDDETQACIKQAEAGPGDTPNLSILIVDNDPTIIDSLTLLFKDAGFQVEAASCGEEALELLAQGRRIDILISDYRLPDYNGIEVVRRVRSATRDTLPAILITGDTQDLLGKELKTAGFDICAVLHKPVDAEQLITLIEECTGDNNEGEKEPTAAS